MPLPRVVYKVELCQILFCATTIRQARHTKRLYKLFKELNIAEKLEMTFEQLCSKKTYRYPESHTILEMLKITPEEFYNNFPNRK